jgi:exonuclease III
MNCRSLRSEAKRNELNISIETHQPHIIHLQETHLDKSIPTSEILDPERYMIVRKDRTCKKGHEGGGVINAVRKDTICSGEDTLDTDCEIAWTKV